MIVPRGNRTGPTGLGPLTGRKASYCSGNLVPGWANELLRRRMLNGVGRRNGRFSRFAGLIPPVAYMAYRVAKRLNNNDQTDQERW
jgi:hypothetical protein